GCSFETELVIPEYDQQMLALLTGSHTCLSKPVQQIRHFLEDALAVAFHRQSQDSGRCQAANSGRYEGYQLIRIYASFVGKFYREPVTFLIDGYDAELRRLATKPGMIEQVAHRCGNRAISILYFTIDFAERSLAFRRGDSFIHAQPLAHIIDVVLGNPNVDPDVYGGRRLVFHRIALQFPDRSLEHPGIEIKTDIVDVA